MASALRYEIATCTLPHSGGDLDLRQVYGWRTQQNVQKSRCRVGGSVETQAIILGRATPMVALSTRDLLTVFGTISAQTGLVIGTGGTPNGAKFRLFERSEGGTFEAFSADSSSHAICYAPGGGLLVPTQLSAAVDDEDGASLGLSFYPIWTGSGKPIVFQDGIDFSAAPQPTFSSQYYLSKVNENGVEMKGIVSAAVDFGLSVTGRTHTPGPYDRSFAISDRNPTITLRAHNLQEVTDLFSAAVDTQLDIYLQAGANTSDRVAYVTASHIRVSCTVGDITVNELGGDAPGDAELEWVIKPIGGTMTLSTGVAIT